MGDVSPTELVADYQRGRITGHELTFRFIQLAASYEPEQLLPLVPEELIGEVRECGMNPPERPQDRRFIHGGTFVGGFDHEAWEREQQASYFAGAWRWHRFLCPQSVAPSGG